MNPLGVAKLASGSVGNNGVVTSLQDVVKITSDSNNSVATQGRVL